MVLCYSSLSRLRQLKFILCVIDFYRFWQMHNIMWPSLLQYHTEQFYCPKNFLRFTYSTLLAIPLATTNLFNNRITELSEVKSQEWINIQQMALGQLANHWGGIKLGSGRTGDGHTQQICFNKMILHGDQLDYCEACLLGLTLSRLCDLSCTHILTILITTLWGVYCLFCFISEKLKLSKAKQLLNVSLLECNRAFTITVISNILNF